jgi:diguanylate cyclase (GGDEF)-like protein
MANQQDRLNKLQVLRQSYVAELPNRLAEIASTWAALQRGEDRDGLHTLHRLAHNLAGSAGTFGYPQLSTIAKDLEQQLLPCLASGLPADNAFLARLTARLAELQATGAVCETACAPQAATHDANTVQVLENRSVFVIEDDYLLAEEIATQLSVYGYEVQTFTSASQAMAAKQGPLPAAIVVDVVLPEGRLAGPELGRQLQTRQEHHIPTIAISCRWDWESRLAAVRAGIDAYYAKPLDLTALAERLDSLTQQRKSKPYRALLVEDSEVLAAHYAEVLKAANMDVHVTHDPTRLLEALDRFAPDLILMDLYMPGCNGIEAAQVIRQDPKFTDLPIVFLSTESGKQIHQAAMRTGADDFLEKPIADADLVSAVTLRAERFRALRGLIRQDSMTGLLNHIAFMLQLEAEISRSARTGTALTLAMLDIDHFKQVNDRHGHPVGDRVITSVSQLLRQRMRKSDILGRYGGEEFAVIMPDTSLQDALKVIDELREQFAQIHHSNGNEHFSCTLSAGIATLAPKKGLSEFIQSADKALYQAKHQGRNRTCIAQG